MSNSNYDFLLNNRGDITFEAMDQEPEERFEFNFHYATSDSLLFNFFPEVNGTKEREPEMLQFNFYTYEVLYDKQNRLITGNEYIQQAIKIALETELGSIRENSDVGSNLYRYRHMFINPDTVIETIEKCATEVIHKIIPNSEVRVHMMRTPYYDFYNAIKISVIFLEQIMWFTL